MNCWGAQSSPLLKSVKLLHALFKQNRPSVMNTMKCYAIKKKKVLCLNSVSCIYFPLISGWKPGFNVLVKAVIDMSWKFELSCLCASQPRVVSHRLQQCPRLQALGPTPVFHISTPLISVHCRGFRCSHGMCCKHEMFKLAYWLVRHISSPDPSVCLSLLS